MNKLIFASIGAALVLAPMAASAGEPQKNGQCKAYLAHLKNLEKNGAFSASGNAITNGTVQFGAGGGIANANGQGGDNSNPDNSAVSPTNPNSPFSQNVNGSAQWAGPKACLPDE